MNRDFKDVRKKRTEHKGKGFAGRPVWDGPVPDRYYYIVKNKRRGDNGPYVGKYTDDPLYAGKVRTLAVIKEGRISLMESDVPLPTGSECRLVAHSKVEPFKRKLFDTLDQLDHTITPYVVKGGKPWTAADEEEVFS